MSIRQSSKVSSSFASRTAFDALAVSDSEEEEEVQEEQEVEVPASDVYVQKAVFYECKY